LAGEIWRERFKNCVIMHGKILISLRQRRYQQAKARMPLRVPYIYTKDKIE
jgi:hypothetical protein